MTQSDMGSTVQGGAERNGQVGGFGYIHVAEECHNACLESIYEKANQQIFARGG